MDELQITCIDNKLFLWGISSDSDEMFTPLDRLEGAYSQFKSTPKRQSLELPAIGSVPMVPETMRMFYSQFGASDSKKAFSVAGVQLSDEDVCYRFLGMEKKHGFHFGASYEFFRSYLRFALGLVARQRFVPYSKNSRSCFIANLDNPDDFKSFNDFCSIAPLSIKPKMDGDVKETLRQCLDYLINLVINESDISINIHNETKTDKWLRGLLGKQEKVDLNKEVEEWLSLGKNNRDLGYNFLFKLTEPQNDDMWRLVYNLQSKKDLSLIIPVSEIWKGRKLPVSNIKIHLLQDLGVASKLSKAIEQSLYKPAPSEAVLSANQAMEFISEDSLLLKDAGFTVQIPKITQAKMNSLKVKVRFKDSKLKVSGTGMLGQALFDFDYEVAIGDLDLSREEFLALSLCKEKLVNVKGKWVEVNPADIKRVVDFFQNRGRLAISDALSPQGINIDSVEVPERFKEEFSGLFNFKDIIKTDPPRDLQGTFRPYQKDGFSWMLFLRNLGFGGILADDMGLGKTIQAIGYLLTQKKPSLVICPTSVLGNWQRELNRFAPALKVHLHYGSERLDKKSFASVAKNFDIILSSYSTARRDGDILGSVEWDTVILDEAQNIKNPYTKQASAISSIKARARFCLTGTPVENRLSELWSIMNFCNPSYLASWDSFKRNFAEPIELESDAYKTELLRKIISPFILRRLKTDKHIIDDLPQKTEIKEYCSLTAEQATLYQAVVDDSLKKIKEDSENRRALIMAALIKLKQVCNHPSNYLKDSTALLDRSGKVERLRELVEVIIGNREKCLIFTQYKEMGELLRADLGNRFDEAVCFLHGQLSKKERELMIDLFQSDDASSPKIFILSLKAGGFGINLTKANHVIHFDRWWNPAVENQATDRAYRIGQTKNVFVYKFITSGTIEEKIDDMIEQKLSLSCSLLSKGEVSLTELDNETLKELFSLRRESLEEV